MEIEFRLKIADVLTDATSVVFRDPTNSFGIRRMDTLATVVAAGAALNHASTGIYNYAFVDPEPGITYHYWIEWVYGGRTYRYQQNIGSASGANVFVNIPTALPRSCVTLTRYAKLTGYSECALWGVNQPSDAHGNCENPIWNEFQRETLLRYLAEAQADIESMLGYPLCATYFANEEHPYRFPLHTRWQKIIEAGVRAETDIQAAAMVDYTNAPAQIGPLVTTVTDESEIKIFYPSSEREIEPLNMTIANGMVTIWIPRCRLVQPDAFDIPEGGLDYNDDANFVETVDVKRVYTDSSVNAALVYAHRNNVPTCGACGCASCGEATQSGCVYVRNALTGALDILPASFTNDVWTANCRACHVVMPDKVRVHYLAGLTERDLTLESAVIRYAHTKMPYAPCGCDPLQSAWTRDNRIPQVLTRERENCPFGLSDGAWFAYRTALSKRALRASVI